MSGLTAIYGRKSPDVAGDPRVAELFKRSTDGHYQAVAAFEATIKGITDRSQVPWTAGLAELTLLNYQWLTVIAWEKVTVSLDAFVVSGEFSDMAYSQVKNLCAVASDASIEAIRLRNEIDKGRQPGLRKLQLFSDVAVAPSNCDAVWATYEALYLRVRASLLRITSIGLPVRLQKVFTQLVDAFEPSQSVFVHLQRQWYASATVDNKIEVIKDASPLMVKFHAVGQQIWTPYMMGPVYTGAVKTAPVFESLKFNFDPWILTDPGQVNQLSASIENCRKLVDFWSTIADPSAAKVLQDEINLHLKSGAVSIMNGRSYKIPPWMPQYSTKAQINIGDVVLGPNEIFTLYPRMEGGKRALSARSIGRI